MSKSKNKIDKNLALKPEFVKIFESDFDEVEKFTLYDWRKFLSGSYSDSTEYLTDRKKATE